MVEKNLKKHIPIGYLLSRQASPAFIICYLHIRKALKTLEFMLVSLPLCFLLCYVVLYEQWMLIRANTRARNSANTV